MKEKYKVLGLKLPNDCLIETNRDDSELPGFRYTVHVQTEVKQFNFSLTLVRLKFHTTFDLSSHTDHKHYTNYRSDKYCYDENYEEGWIKLFFKNEEDALMFKMMI